MIGRWLLDLNVRDGRLWYIVVSSGHGFPGAMLADLLLVVGTSTWLWLRLPLGVLHADGSLYGRSFGAGLGSRPGAGGHQNGSLRGCIFLHSVVLWSLSCRRS